MKADLSRWTFDANRHYRQVLMQQGRVTLDADFNENTSILLHYLETLAADIIGPYGGPADIKTTENKTLKVNCGFEIIASEERINQLEEFSSDEKKELVKLLNQSAPALLIGKGNYYVAGKLCENAGYLRYDGQPGFPFQNPPLEKGKNYLFYLDVWERLITWLDDPRIREVALGGPDTTARTQLVWQVKVQLVPDTYGGNGNWRAWAETHWASLVEAWQPKQRGWLKVQLNPEQTSTDPCTIPPKSRYRGQENQLYRVEIHAGGNLKQNKPTFKWSCDNGSIVAAWLGPNDDGGMIVSSARGFAAGQWVEIISDAQELRGEPGAMVKLTKVENGALYPESPQTWDEKSPKKIRRWDHVEKDALPINEGTTDKDWIDLENGLQVQFQPNGNYRTGDYWLIPARTDGTIGWPVQTDPTGKPTLDTDGHTTPLWQAPHGITHYYAPLWIIENKDKLTADPKNDLRKKFSQLAEYGERSLRQ